MKNSEKILNTMRNIDKENEKHRASIASNMKAREDYLRSYIKALENEKTKHI